MSGCCRPDPCAADHSERGWLLHTVCCGALARLDRLEAIALAHLDRGEPAELRCPEHGALLLTVEPDGRGLRAVWQRIGDARAHDPGTDAGVSMGCLGCGARRPATEFRVIRAGRAEFRQPCGDCADEAAGMFTRY